MSWTSALSAWGALLERKREAHSDEWVNCIPHIGDNGRSRFVGELLSAWEPRRRREDHCPWGRVRDRGSRPHPELRRRAGILEGCRRESNRSVDLARFGGAGGCSPSTTWSRWKSGCAKVLPVWMIHCKTLRSQFGRSVPCRTNP